ncbi:hypothetical protein V6N11_053632 [Hibiscus sabdariffa]|uniref:Uncharacterized protein n=2 Tax=Hibiscus sabdariffa TaxID=183260 RepID=A0ABR2N767_9ROSI
MHAGKEKFNDHSRELELTRKLYNYYELLGGVPTGDLVLIEKEVAVVEGEEKWQIENMEGVGCINNKYRSSLLVGLGESLFEKMDLKVNKLEVQIVGLDKKKGIHLDLLSKEGDVPNMLSTDKRVTCYTAVLDGSKEKSTEPKFSWTKVVENLINSSQIQSWKD